MPDKSKYNLAFQPSSYLDISDPAKDLISRIKGDVRRSWAIRSLENEDVVGEEGLQIPDFVLKEELTDEERLMFGGVHPTFMGGEYLPALEPHEVEIVRISLKSTTGDVMSLRAQVRGESIRYRIVDDYYDDPVTQFKLSPQESVRPFTMGEIIDLIDGAEDEMNPEFGRGLTSSFRNCNLDGMRPEELVDFVTVSSRFYAELAAYYSEEASEWLEAQKKRLSDD